jgi:hypothetical protein
MYSTVLLRAIAFSLTPFALVLASQTLHAATITATSCGQAQVQAAINAAANGDTVVIPNGTCTWTASVTFGGKGIKLIGQTKGQVIITHSAGTAVLLNVDSHPSYNVEVANLTFVDGAASGSAEYLGVSGSGRPALVHDNYFRNVSFKTDCIRWSATGGVIWNNVFESLDVDGSKGGCLLVKNPNLVSGWTTASTMGTADVGGTTNVYIEDNVFKKILYQSIDIDDNMRAVIRYNTFDNSGIVYHGADTSSVGVRHVEVYNNTFIFTTSGSGYNFPLNLNWWLYMRGGTGVWTDNVMPDISSTMWGNKPELNLIVQNLRRNDGPYPCWTTYPVPHQIGQSFNGTTTYVDPLYIWNNTGSGSQAPGFTDYSPNQCAGSNSTSTWVQVGRDVIVGSPKPGYVKYAYPHPLRTGVAPSPQPAPTPSPSVLPAPSNLRVIQ